MVLLQSVLHSKPDGFKDHFLRENIVASYSLEKIFDDISNYPNWALTLSMACHDAFSFLTITHLVQKKRNLSESKFLLKERNFPG